MVLKSEKQKKKGSSPHFETFPPIFCDFPSSCSIFYFFLASVFPIGQHKFTGQKSGGGGGGGGGGSKHSAPCPPCYATAVVPVFLCEQT